MGEPGGEGVRRRPQVPSSPHQKGGGQISPADVLSGTQTRPGARTRHDLSGQQARRTRLAGLAAALPLACALPSHEAGRAQEHSSQNRLRKGCTEADPAAGFSSEISCCSAFLVTGLRPKLIIPPDHCPETHISNTLSASSTCTFLILTYLITTRLQIP